METLSIQNILDNEQKMIRNTYVSDKEKLVLNIISLVCSVFCLDLFFGWFLNYAETYSGGYVGYIYTTLSVIMIVLTIQEIIISAKNIYKQIYNIKNTGNNDEINSDINNIEKVTNKHFIDVVIAKVIGVGKGNGTVDFELVKAGKNSNSISVLNNKRFTLRINGNTDKFNDLKDTEAYILFIDGKASGAKVFSKLEYEFDIDDKKLIKERYYIN